MNLGFTIWKNTVLNPTSRASRIANDAADKLQKLGYDVASISFDVVTHKFNIFYYDRGFSQDDHKNGRQLWRRPVNESSLDEILSDSELFNKTFPRGEEC